jgi:hypothetical protein
LTPSEGLTDNYYDFSWEGSSYAFVLGCIN